MAEERRADRIVVSKHPLEVVTCPGLPLRHHPLLSDSFLDDVYECFEDQRPAH